LSDALVVGRRRQSCWMVAVVLDRKTLRLVHRNRGTRVDWHWNEELVRLPRLQRNMLTLKYVWKIYTISLWLGLCLCFSECHF